MKNIKNVLVDMSASLIHHGHIRLLKRAHKHGRVIVALTTDNEIKKSKKFVPEIKYKFRSEILKSIKYVYDVIPSKFQINNKFLKKNKIDILVNGGDYKNRKLDIKTITYKRTSNISSSLIRKRAAINCEKKK